MVINPLWAAEPPSSNSIQFNKLLQLLILQIDPNITIRLQKSNLDSWLFPHMTFIRTENNTVDNLLSVTHLTRFYFQTDICNLWISANFCHISAQRLEVFSSRSDLHSEFTCVVKNNNISAPLRHTVHLDMNCKSARISLQTGSCPDLQSDQCSLRQRHKCLYTWFIMIE